MCIIQIINARLSIILSTFCLALELDNISVGDGIENVEAEEMIMNRVQEVNLVEHEKPKDIEENASHTVPLSRWQPLIHRLLALHTRYCCTNIKKPAYNSYLFKLPLYFPCWYFNNKLWLIPQVMHSRQQKRKGRCPMLRTEAPSLLIKVCIIPGQCFPNICGKVQPP